MVEIVFEILRNESWLHIENANCVQRSGFYFQTKAKELQHMYR